MKHSSFYRPSQHAIALVGTYLPRRCGIATFSHDLLHALAAEASDTAFWAMAVNDTPGGYSYGPEVRFELAQNDLADYRLAADYLNMNPLQAVSLQHEYGIFGGPDGSHILELIENLRVPVVTTLHTVLQNPSSSQKSVLGQIARISDRLVVMSRKAVEILIEVYGVKPGKVVLIQHGIPDVPFVDPAFYKDQFGLEGHKVILTFGLVSPGKGLEYMIDALPEIVRHEPDAVYMILGATHPHVKREQGESYRLSLQRRARDLGVGEHLIFHNRFVELHELCEFLGAADVYVTPYLNKEQIVSGTLAYALGAGKAVISTPYWYAQEMLDEGRGRLAGFRDSEALAAQVVDLFQHSVQRDAMRKRAYTFCRHMIWKEVARQYLEVFSTVRDERARRPRIPFLHRTVTKSAIELPQLKLDHLRLLTDDVGILQHANFIVPNRAHGYCTDDNARALIVVLGAAELSPEHEQLNELACRYLSFLDHAFNPATGRFRNFMSYDRRWLEEEGSEDCHARAMRGLGEAVARAASENLTGVALSLFHRGLPALLELSAPRAWAYGLIGIHAYLRRFSGDSEARRAREELAGHLFDLYSRNATDEWPWIEDKLTYANAKISQALLMSGQWLGRGDMVEAGLRSLEWLFEIQMDPKGHFVPVGNRGWYPRGGEKARFDQQPIEAHSMIEACREAFHVTQEERWIERAHRVMEWFLGRNDLNLPLYDYQSGGCCDGLTMDGVNRNQGAESTLALLMSLLNIYFLNQYKAGTARAEMA